MFKEIIKYRDLLKMLTLREIRIRYKQASLGFLWAIFMPLMAILAGILVRKAMSIVSGTPMELKGIISISVKVLPWTFFITTIKFCLSSLIGDRNLVTKIYFPREVIPFAYILASLFDFCIASAALLVLFIFAKVGISIYILWVPLLLFCLILFTAGLGLMLAAANLFLRDIKYVVEILIMFGIFFTPVFYDASMFGKWKLLLLANPIGSILEGLNQVVVLRIMPNPIMLTYIAISSFLMFFFGLVIFHKSEPYFAESI